MGGEGGGGRYRCIGGGERVVEGDVGGGRGW